MFGIVFTCCFVEFFLRFYRVEVHLAQRPCFSLYREGTNNAATRDTTACLVRCQCFPFLYPVHTFFLAVSFQFMQSTQYYIFRHHGCKEAQGRETLFGARRRTGAGLPE
ncbi:hypothetical protein VTN31DRAFT_7411 [Thermomyces dupontii]|uniref:uncharacterized protein n=1 Tax=Talaromyces thermophilus TaxID=28565 RepID=UPI003742156C